MSSTASGCGGRFVLPRRPKILLGFILLIAVAYLGMAAVQWELDRRRYTPFDVTPPDPIGQGIMFFAYGTEASTLDRYLKQAVLSARRIKSLDPGTNITLVTNPDVSSDMEGVFDLVFHVDKKYLYPGEIHKHKIISQQWLTRLEYMSCSPYEVTLALDSQALCCTSGVDKILEQSWEEFDISFATQGPQTMESHNWAIMYRLNDRTRRLFSRWRTLQQALSRAGSDQLTLYTAAGSLALQGELDVGVLSQNVAMSMVIYNRTVPKYPKTSALVDPRPVHFIHLDAETEEGGNAACEEVNKEQDRARVVVLPRSFPRDTETHRMIINYEVAYSEEELAAATNAAREGAPYFRGLDWENASGKWGHVATPWKDHCPGCWEDLPKGVNNGVRHIFRKRRYIWPNKHEAEFGVDNL